MGQTKNWGRNQSHGREFKRINFCDNNSAPMLDWIKSNLSVIARPMTNNIITNYILFFAAPIVSILTYPISLWAQETKEFIPATTKSYSFYPVSIESSIISTETSNTDLLTFGAKNSIRLSLTGDDFSIPYGSISSAGSHSGSIFIAGMTSNPGGAITSGSLELDSKPSDKVLSAIEILNQKLLNATPEERDRLLQEFADSVTPIVETETFSKVVTANVTYSSTSNSPIFVNNFSNVIFNSLGR